MWRNTGKNAMKRFTNQFRLGTQHWHETRRFALVAVCHPVQAL
jgi:hypothetical protein